MFSCSYILGKRGIQLAKDYNIKVADDLSIDWKQYRKLRDLFLQDSSNSKWVINRTSLCTNFTSVTSTCHASSGNLIG